MRLRKRLAKHGIYPPVGYLQWWYRAHHEGETWCPCLLCVGRYRRAWLGEPASGVDVEVAA